MSNWFSSNSVIGSISKKIPTGLVNIGGNVIRDALGLGKNPGYAGPVRTIERGEYADQLSVQNFLTDVRTRGIAKQNRYMIAFRSIPKKIVDNVTEGHGIADPGFEKSLEYLNNGHLDAFVRSCESAAFPGVNIQTQEHRHQGYLEKMPIVRNNNETTWTFRCDNEMLEKKFFDVWLNAVVNKDTGDVSYKTGYAIDADIIQFDEHGKITYSMKLLDFYPTQIADLDVGQSSNDYHRVSVTFAYSKIYYLYYDNPDYRENGVVKASGTRQLTLFDKITGEVFKAGKNIVLKKVGKNLPSNFPGLGSPRDMSSVLGRLF